ncbi:MAG: polysaccharide biosynthesis protein, partial [Prevotella sp.]|nr:polysaccharide biosynthesis protein [Prevotella sp.]
MRKSFFSNIGYSFFAQIVQLALSVTVSFLLPKMLGIEQFGYWQLFIFYNSFAGFFHLGLVDGIYLKEGGNSYSGLNFNTLGFQLKVMAIFNCILILFGVSYSVLFVAGSRRFVVVASCIFILISNINSFFSLLLQSVNEIKKSSLGRLFYSIPFLLFILLEFFVVRNNYFQIFVFVYFIANLLSLLFFIINTSDVLKKVFAEYHPGYKNEMIENLKNGFVLMLANVTGLLILGFGRFMIDSTWGIEIFSVVSFALTLVNFVLMFTNQISV